MNSHRLCEQKEPLALLEQSEHYFAKVCARGAFIKWQVHAMKLNFKQTATAHLVSPTL